MRKATAWRVELPLVGAGGEKVDLWRTIVSHGIASLPPARVDEEARILELTLPVKGARPHTVAITEGDGRHAVVTAVGAAPSARKADAILAGVEHVLRLDETCRTSTRSSPATGPCLGDTGRQAHDPEPDRLRGRRQDDLHDQLRVVGDAAHGRCASSSISGSRRPAHHRRLVRTCVSHAGSHGRSGEDFYRDVVRAGYRGPYLISLAGSVADGTIDLEELGTLGPDDLPDEEVTARLLALPGVGPYAAAHVMMLVGRYSPLILDSWTRPTYARLNGRAAKDATIERRFRRYGRYAGLAFWLYLTRDWA